MRLLKLRLDKYGNIAGVTMTGEMSGKDRSKALMILSSSTEVISADKKLEEIKTSLSKHDINLEAILEG